MTEGPSSVGGDNEEAELRVELARLQARLEGRDQTVRALLTENAELVREVAATRRELEALLGTTGQRILGKYARLREQLLPPGSPQRAVMERLRGRVPPAAVEGAGGAGTAGLSSPAGGAAGAEKPVRRRILVIDQTVPETDKDAGSRCLASFLDAMLALDFEVTFFGDDFSLHGAYGLALEQRGVTVLHGQHWARHWGDWISAHADELDAVLINRPGLARKYLDPVRRLTRARVIFFGHDLHFLRERRRDQVLASAATGASAAMDISEAEEFALMGRMDHVITLSADELPLIRAGVPTVPATLVPGYTFVPTTDEYKPTERSGIFFIGGFRHQPNLDGALWLLKEVLPLLRERHPGMQVTIAGSHCPPELLERREAGVNILGYVSAGELAILYRQARVVVVPLRFGAGVKGKTVEAMAHGVPVVATPCGIEGMPWVEAIIPTAADAAGFAARVLALYDDPAALVAQAQGETAYVAGHFSAAAMVACWRTLLAVPARV